MRNIGISVLLFLLLLVGCGSNTNSAVLNLHNISFLAEVTCNNMAYSVDCCIGTNKDFSATVVSPDYLSGITYSLENGNSVFSYEGVRISDIDLLLPDDNFLVLFKEILCTCDGAVFDANKGKNTVIGNIGGNSYSIVASPSGLPISMMIDGIGAKITFKNVTCL